MLSDGAISSSGHQGASGHAEVAAHILYAHRKKKQKNPHQHTTDKPHMMEGARCVFLTRMHSFISSRGGKGTDASTTTAKQVKAERSSERGRTAVVARHENEKLRRGKNKTKKKGDMNKREGEITP